MWSETFANDSTRGKFINQNQESTGFERILSGYIPVHLCSHSSRTLRELARETSQVTSCKLVKQKSS